MTWTRTWWALGVVIVCLAAYVCLAPGDDVPGAFELNDKVSHAIGHALLAIYFSGLVARLRWWKILLSLTLFGVGIEVAQHFMQLGREADIRDVAANFTGEVVGLGLAHFGLCRWPRWLEWAFGRRTVA